VNFDSNPDVALQQRIRWENASPEERRSLRPKPPPMPFGPPLVCSLCQAPCPDDEEHRCPVARREAWWTAAMVLVLVGVPGGLFAILWALGGQP
jgi:hypothetical protein